MAFTAEHKALLFVGAIAVLGAGVRIVRGSDGRSPDDSQPALEHQVGAADSASRARKGPKSRQKGPRARSATPRRDSASSLPPWPPPPDPPGYYLGKLDLDAATPAQIDSLPGIGPTLAKRIVTDRAAHGPFSNISSLARVSGIRPTLLEKLQTLVTFSGTLRPLNATPESVSARPTRRRSPRR